MTNATFLTDRQAEGQTDRQYYPIIDLLKFICALLVVTIHVSPLSSFSEEIPIINYINYGIRNYLARIAVPFYFTVAGFFLFRKIDFAEFDISVTKGYIFKLLRLLGVWTVLLFVGSKGLLWYMSGLIFAVCFLTVLLYKRVPMKKMVVIAILLYIIGLLGDSYFGLLKALPNDKVMDYAIKAYETIFVTTRNGLFMGFPFLLLGGVIEKKKVSVKPLYAFMGLVFSMLLLFGEAVLLAIWKLPKDTNMYIFLLPVTFFLLVFAINVPVKRGTDLRKLRNVSVIVYFTQNFIFQWIIWGVKAADRLFGIKAYNSLLYFLLTVILTIILGIVIDRLSKKEKWSFLRYLYS